MPQHEIIVKWNKEVSRVELMQYMFSCCFYYFPKVNYHVAGIGNRIFFPILKYHFTNEKCDAAYNSSQ